MKRATRTPRCGAFAPLGFLALLGYLGLGGSCASTTTPYDDVEQWLCFEQGEGCDCYGRPSGTLVEDPRPTTPGCSSELDCCFVKDRLDGTYDCGCIPTPPEESSGGAAGAAGASGETSPESRCLLAAAKHGTTTVVAHCPPLTLDSPGICALTFESCEPEYLKKNGLVACCDGLVCKPDSTGQKICAVSN